MLKRLSDDRGFTLIELLVVILIIGILAAVALPSFLGQTNKAKDSEATQKVRNAYSIAKAEQASADGNFPGIAALKTAYDASETDDSQTAAVGVVTPAGNAGIVTFIEVGTTTDQAFRLAVKSDSGKVMDIEVNDQGVATDSNPRD